MEILKRPSDNQTKFDLFQRLNAGGTQANPQELRNCIMLMVNESSFHLIKQAAERETFLKVVAASEEQIEKQRHIEFAVRFLVYTYIPYDGLLDVEEYIDEGIVTLLNDSQIIAAIHTVTETFDLLNSAAGSEALRRYDGNKHVGKVGLVGIEGIAVGVARNLSQIKLHPQPVEYVQQRIKDFWVQAEVNTFTSPGLRGTVRLQRTIPFGAHWFHP